MNRGFEELITLTGDTDADEYVFCDPCGDFVYEYCSIHGPLLVIPDNKVQNKPFASVPHSALTIPDTFLHIAPSSIQGAGLGVFATLTIPRGVRFGPYQGKRVKNTTTCRNNYCWQIYDSKQRPTYVVDASDSRSSNWMRYVNSARYFGEQNLVAYQYQGKIFYRTIKIIPRHTELLVFYGVESAISLNIDLRTYESCSQIAFYKNIGASSKVDAPSESRRKMPLASTFTQSEKVFLHKRNLSPNRTLYPIQMELNTNQKSTNMDGNAMEIVICNECNNVFNSKKLLISHIETLHTVKSDICAKVFCNKKSLDYHLHYNHELKTNGLNNFSCPYCHRSYTRKSSLQEHILVKHNFNQNNQLSCPHCEKKFVVNRYLQRHVSQTHSSEKKFLCLHCDQRFKVRRSLNEHIEVKHTSNSEKKYACHLCDKTYLHKRSLENHLRTHYHHH